MIQDESLVDALDELRANLHPLFAKWSRDMARGARKNAAKHDPSFVACWQAFAKLVRALGDTDQPKADAVDVAVSESTTARAA